MNQKSGKQKQHQQSQGDDKKTGLQQGANLGQKDAERDKKSGAEIKRMGEGDARRD
jgi:hypothetical protein